MNILTVPTETYVDTGKESSVDWKAALTLPGLVVDLDFWGRVRRRVSGGS